MSGPPDQRLLVWIAVGLGLIGWSFIEYGVHRFILHGVRPFSAWHAAHHEGLSPSWRGMKTLLCVLTIIGVVLTPAALLGEVWLGMGLGLGLLAGYGSYAAIHHAIHHWHCEHIWLTQRKFHHALHHDTHRPHGYYGVTSSVWDDVLGSNHRHEF
jgi:sterol desaturase/sphingolipid hydroxylase (fatty acid hydroxylase superfamily)